MTTPKVIRRRTLHKLETGWKDNLSQNDIEETKLKWRELSTSHSELKKILSSSAPELSTVDAVSNISFSKIVDKRKKKAIDEAIISDDLSNTPFASIAKTFGFRHHEGTDRVIELKIYKSILIREGLLTKLEDLCDKLKKDKVKSLLESGLSAVILDSLAQLKNITVEIVLSIISWRETMPNNDPDLPRPFIWNDINYLLKLVSDADFLADCHVLVMALHIPARRLHVNPLMLPNALSEYPTGKHPSDLAIKDAKGVTHGSAYEERLRYRNAELVLIREIAFNINGTPSVDWEGDYIKYKNQMKKQKAMEYSESFQTASQSLLHWNMQANLQLQKLEDSVGDKLLSRSTNRMDIPKLTSSSSGTLAKYAHPLAPDYVQPTKLYNLSSSSISIEQASLITSVAADVPMLSSTSVSPLRGTNNVTKKDSSFSSMSIKPQTDSVAEEEAEDYEMGIRIIQSGRITSNSAPASLPSIYSSNSKKQQIQNQRLEPIRSPAHDSRLGLEQIFEEDIELIVGVTAPPSSLCLAGAAILVLISSKIEKVSDLSWDAFIDLTMTVNVPRRMNILIPSKISKRRLAAVTKYAGPLKASKLSEEEEDLNLSSFEATGSALKLINWVITVVTNAHRGHQMIEASGGHVDDVSVSVSSSDSYHGPLKVAFAPLPSQSFEKVQKVPVKVIKSKVYSTSTKSTVVATKHFQLGNGEIDMETKLTEMVTGVFERPLVLILLASTKIPVDRHVAIVFDPLTNIEAKVAINSIEYCNFKSDLDVKYENNPKVSEAFQPKSTTWWIQHLKSIILVKSDERGKLKLRISKKAIDKKVASIINPKETTGSEAKEAVTGTSSGKVNASSSSGSAWAFHTEQVMDEGELEDVEVDKGLTVKKWTESRSETATETEEKGPFDWKKTEGSFNATGDMDNEVEVAADEGEAERVVRQEQQIVGHLRLQQEVVSQSHAEIYSFKNVDDTNDTPFNNDNSLSSEAVESHVPVTEERVNGKVKEALVGGDELQMEVADLLASTADRYPKPTTELCYMADVYAEDSFESLSPPKQAVNIINNTAVKDTEDYDSSDDLYDVDIGHD